jgi:hypothetical protein
MSSSGRWMRSSPDHQLSPARSANRSSSILSFAGPLSDRPIHQVET